MMTTCFLQGQSLVKAWWGGEEQRIGCIKSFPFWFLSRHLGLCLVHLSPFVSICLMRCSLGKPNNSFIISRPQYVCIGFMKVVKHLLHKCIQKAFPYKIFFEGCVVASLFLPWGGPQVAKKCLFCESAHYKHITMLSNFWVVHNYPKLTPCRYIDSWPCSYTYASSNEVWDSWPSCPPSRFYMNTYQTVGSSELLKKSLLPSLLSPSFWCILAILSKCNKVKMYLEIWRQTNCPWVEKYNAIETSGLVSLNSISTKRYS